jgi:hypothetical protein
VANPLLTDLVSWWTQDDEAGTTWADAHGTNGLDTTGTVIEAAGHVNGCSDAAGGGGNYLHCTAASLSPADAPFTFAGWVNLDTTGFQGVLGSADGTNGWALRVSFGTTFNFLWMKGGADKQINDVTVTAATWFFIVFGYDHAAQQVFYSVGGAAKTTSAWVGGLGTSSDFRLHEPAITGGAGGLCDECAVWSRVLTDAEITELWNGGAGISYNDL